MSEKGKAIQELRNQNKTYKEISEILGVSKSLISYWCSSVPPSEELIKIQQIKQSKNAQRLKLTPESTKKEVTLPLSFFQPCSEAKEAFSNFLQDSHKQ